MNRCRIFRKIHFLKSGSPLSASKNFRRICAQHGHQIIFPAFAGVFLQEKGGLTFCQSNISPDDIQDIEDAIRRRVLKLFGRKGWIEKKEAENLQAWENSGFSLNGAVCVESWDRSGLERLLRYCARAPFVSENFKTYRDKIVYTLPKPNAEGVRFIQLTPLELISRLSKLIPDPRCHQHHYHGTFAPNAPIRKKLVLHANRGIDEHVPIIEMPMENSNCSLS